MIARSELFQVSPEFAYIGGGRFELLRDRGAVVFPYSIKCEIERVLEPLIQTVVIIHDISIFLLDVRQ